MILVTGHKGYIGSLLFQKIGDIGIDLRDGFNLLTCDVPKNVDTIYHLRTSAQGGTGVYLKKYHP